VSVELKLWNKERPEAPATQVVVTSAAAGVFLGGAIQAALDSGGTLVVEAKETN
jgi:hypothetical protein